MTLVRYRALEERSPNGRFVFEARGRPLRYRLREDGQVVWERAQQESSPLALEVADDGFAVVQTHRQVGPGEILLFAPDGQLLLRLVVGEDWEPDSGYPTTAGYWWTSGSQRYFFRHDDTTYFTWRTGLGRRLLVRLSPPAVCEVGGELQGACRAAEDLVTERQLKSADADRTRLLRDLKGALSSLLLRPRPADLGDLRRAEARKFLTSTSSQPGLGFRSAGWVGLRPAVQQVLRRLGHEPQGAAYRFLLETPYKTRHYADRADRLRSLSPGLTTQAVLDRAGCPDYFTCEKPGLYRLEYGCTHLRVAQEQVVDICAGSEDREPLILQDLARGAYGG